jgi:hypothetical protein
VSDLCQTSPDLRDGEFHNEHSELSITVILVIYILLSLSLSLYIYHAPCVTHVDTPLYI